jgi:hypothetical protein
VGDTVEARLLVDEFVSKKFDQQPQTTPQGSPSNRAKPSREPQQKSKDKQQQQVNN